MQEEIRQHVIRARGEAALEDLSQVETVTEADTVYHIDRISEEAILSWFEANWPAELSTVLVMEGLPDENRMVFPRATPAEQARFICIVDPIDGTRGLMYDKRSAWVLAGIAPNRGSEANLSDIEVAVMTELPTSKQRLADQMSAVRGAGIAGVRSERVDLVTGVRAPLPLRPSQAVDLHHGFATVSRFFTAGKELLARFEEQLHARLYGAERIAELAIFEDQYICSGGQIAELCTGRDRMIADLRPLAHETLGLEGAMDCHPYDICTALILTELGGVVSKPLGGDLDAPLNTTASVAWVGFANPVLADHVRPAWDDLVAELFPTR